MKNFAGRTKICRTINCNKEVWIDEYCKKCADYIIQKETLSSLEINTKLMLNIANNMRNIETRLTNIESNYPRVITTSNKDQISILDEESPFIPSIDINNNKAVIFDNKSTTSNRDMSDIAKKLPT